MIKKKRKLSESEAMNILKDIVSGFIEIGKNGFLHRDLKLANIFIKDGIAKIADFGFKKRINIRVRKKNIMLEVHSICLQKL